MEVSRLRRVRVGALLMVSGLLCLSACDTHSSRPEPTGSAETGTPSLGQEPPVLRYVGSSTIANFMSEAEDVYGKATFALETQIESVGGEQAIRDGEVDLAGVAREPDEGTLAAGVHATLIGTDTIAVVANVNNPVLELSVSQLRDIYTGRINNWKDLGGQDVPIVPFIVAANSATHHVFRERILGSHEYQGCQVVAPDPRMTAMVESEPGGVGMISSSFLCSGGSVRVVNVDGQRPLPSNGDYPIRRPLYLLWRPDNLEVERFIAWTSSKEAAAVVEKCFGLNVSR